MELGCPDKTMYYSVVMSIELYGVIQHVTAASYVSVHSQCESTACVKYYMCIMTTMLSSGRVLVVIV